MGGHHEPYKVPSYKIYKVSDVPELLAVERALAAKGLKDPWLRNEVWRYNPKEFGTHAQRFRTFLFRGFGLGVAALAVTIAGETVYKLAYPEEPHGHHGGH